MYYLGIDIGFTKCAVSLGQTAGEEKESLALADKAVFLTPVGSAEEVQKHLLLQVGKILLENELNFKSVKAVGIIAAAPFNAEKTGLEAVEYPSRPAVELVSFFKEKTGAACYLAEREKAALSAEQSFGKASEKADILYLCCGSNLTVQCVQNGELLAPIFPRETEKDFSFAGSDAENFGIAAPIFCGLDLVSLAKEKIKSEPEGAVKRLFEAAEKKEEKITAKLMAAQATEQKDAFCLAAFRQCGKTLGQLLLRLVCRYRPKQIMLGGIYARVPQLIFPAMREELEKAGCDSYESLLEPVALGENLGDFAALLTAMGEIK